MIAVGLVIVYAAIGFAVGVKFVRQENEEWNRKFGHDLFEGSDVLMAGVVVFLCVLLWPFYGLIYHVGRMASGKETPR